MKSSLLTCPVCHKYTLKDSCGDCKEKTITPHPARFSPQDRYGKYRRALIKSNSEGGRG